MSSPNHPTSDIEDAFSSTNTLDYTSASLDYFPTSPGNTSSDSLNNSSGLVPIAIPPKRKSTSVASSSTTPTMTQAAIRQLISNSVTAALETHAATRANTKITNRNTRPKETPVIKRGNYKEFISCQPFYFNGMEGAVGLIRWFKQTESVFSCSNCAEENKVTYATAILCPNMVPNTEKLMEVFIGGLLQSIEGTVTTSKPQTLEEATNIAQRLIDQIIKLGSMQGTSDHKRKFDDRRNSNNNNNYPNNCVNNYQNNRNNNSNRINDYRQQQNKRLETFKAYAATLTENNGYTGNHPLCKKCTLHYTKPCTVKCQTCNKVGHLTKNCRNKGPTTRSNQQPVSVIYHAYEEKGHYNYQCSKANNNAQGRAYLLRDKNAHRDPNVVTGKEELYAKFSKCDFWISVVQFLGHVIDSQGLYVDPTKIEAVKNWASPTTPTEIHQFLGLAGYYQRFINIKAAPFEELYGQKCKSPVCWAEVGDVQLTGPEIIHETTKKIVQIRQRLQAARDQIGPVAYKLKLPEELKNVHTTFHVSNLKKCPSDESFVILIKELRLDDKLNFVEEPVEIMDREDKQLRQSRIPIVKVRWDSKKGPEFT
nr:hypothetical protein [Tanacetum cinerariifolium]